MQRHFDPVSLRLFVAVCEEGNIALAGEREAIVPSAISKRIAALEDYIGTQVLVRSRHGIKPTAAGEALLRQAREILSMMDRAHAELADYKAGVHGSVHVLASLSVLSEGLPDDLARFLALYRSVRVSFEERVTAEIVRGVREGRADFGICWSAGDLSGLDETPYGTDQLCAVTYPGHPLAERTSVPFVELLEHEVINVQPGSIMQTMLTRQAAKAGKTLSFRLQVSNFESALRFISARLGVAVLPMEIAGPTSGALGLRMVPLSDAWARRRFVIVTRQEGAVSSTARLLISFLRERAAEQAARRAAPAA